MRRLYSQLHHHAAALWRRLRHVVVRSCAPATGQGLVEYGLLLVLIMVVCVGILTVVGQTVSAAWYDQIIQAFN